MTFLIALLSLLFSLTEFAGKSLIVLAVACFLVKYVRSK
jgi:hypothetical protein